MDTATTIIQTTIDNRQIDREVVIIVLLFLYLSTQLSKHVLPKIFPRINYVALHRQRQLFTLWPMMALKIAVSLLITGAEYPSQLRSMDASKPFELLDHQVNIFYILVIGYMFELLYRPSPIELDIHHIFVIMGYFYYRFRSSTQDPTATVQLFQLAIIIVIYGIGPVDLASESMRFIHYAMAPNAWTAYAMHAFAGMAWLGRITQWIVMVEHLSGTFWELLEAWGPVEMLICAMFIAFWIWMETVEIFHLVGLAKRYAGRTQKLAY